MYLVTYQKRNGTVFCRIRNTMPECGIGHDTSMGWKILDIKYRYKDNFYDLGDCRTFETKRRKRIDAYRIIKKLYSKYATTILLILILYFITK